MSDVPRKRRAHVHVIEKNVKHKALKTNELPKLENDVENAGTEEDFLNIWNAPGKMDGDTELIVGAKKLRVNSIYLAQYSSFFHNLFNLEFLERKTGKFEIKDVNVEEIIELMKVIFPSRRPITEENVHFLSALADQFLIDSLQQQCHSFLNQVDKSSVSDDSDDESSDDSDSDNDAEKKNSSVLHAPIEIWNAPCGRLESDTIIQVGPNKKSFRVNKVYLAQHSSVFYNMFYHPNKTRKNVLQWVDADHFTEFLHVILPTRKPVTALNVEVLFSIATTLELSSLIRECIHILTSPESEFAIQTLIQLALKSDSKELKELCRLRFPSQEHVDSLKCRQAVASKRCTDDQCLCCELVLTRNALNWLSELRPGLPKCLTFKRPKVFFDLLAEGGEQGRVEMELFTHTAPQTAENFRSLCTGERGIGLSGKPLHYKGIELTKQKGAVRGALLESIYGYSYEMEDDPTMIYATGCLVMTSSRRFAISLCHSNNASNRSSVMFGRVTNGIQMLLSNEDFVVENCGEL